MRGGERVHTGENSSNKIDAFLTTVINENSYEIVLVTHRFSCVVPYLLAFFEDRKVIIQLVKPARLVLYSWWWEG